MDENFNNQTNMPDGNNEQSATDTANTQSGSVNSTPNEPVGNTFSSNAYNGTQSGSYSNYSQNPNPQQQNPDGSYSQSYNAPNYNSSQYGNQYSAPYGNPYAPPQPSQPPKKKNSKKGKNIFAIIVCVCIVVASIAIGISVSDSNKVSGGNSSNATHSDSSANNSAAEPNVEDSPISYSEYSGEGKMTSEQIYKEVSEINVGIIVYSQNQKAGEGSGIVAGEDKTKTYTYIITAAHVISDSGVKVQVQFHDETQLDAEIVGFDSKTDVGVLRVKKTGFTAATFGNSDKLAVGQTIYAIGNPGGTEFFGSFTKGMISAIDRPVASSASAYDLPCIQHTAAINPGNSGGALVNEYGQVIGLNSSKISATDYEGMGFSVPSNTMLEIYNDIVKNGYVTNRPMLGISYYAVSSDYSYAAIAWKNNLPYGSIVIATISDESDMKNQGIQVGDIITAVNGKSLDTTDALLEVIENAKVGDKLKLSVVRLSNNGSISTKFDATVTLVEDKGTNSSSSQAEETTNPFSSYFNGGFGY